jgi:imidazolonepropionase-like amidohydrolase
MDVSLSLKLHCACLLLAFVACSAVGFAEEQPPLALTHVTVFDGTGRPLQIDQTVVIENKRITRIASSAGVKLSKDTRIIDAHGKFLIPGLWDMHVHIAGVNADPSWSKNVLLPLLVANGITGVRDMGGDLDALLAWRRDIESGALLGPHIVAAGPFIVAGGKKSAEQYPVANAAEAREAVRDLKQRGADFIKIITLPSKEAFFALADEAGKQHISFVGHLPIEVGALEASNAGMRGIEHFFYSEFALSLSSKEEELRRRLMEAQAKRDFAGEEEIRHEAEASYSAEKAATLFAALKKNKTCVTPTLASLDITAHPELWRADDPQLAFVAPAMAKEWRDSFNDAGMKQRAASLGRQTANDWKLTGELHRAGVSLLAGSDSLDPFVFPGQSLHQELAEFVRAGFTPAEALQAATRGAAQFLEREQDFGTVETGKLADVTLLDANPLEDIANTRKVFAVVRNGQYLDRAALDAMLAKAKAAAAEAK